MSLDLNGLSLPDFAYKHAGIPSSVYGFLQDEHGQEILEKCVKLGSLGVQCIKLVRTLKANPKMPLAEKLAALDALLPDVGPKKKDKTPPGVPA